MIVNRLFSLMLAALCLVASGCTGTPLRNLLTRSDYESLEDLESEEGAVQSTGRSDSLVSQEREVTPDEDKPDAEKPKSKRRGLFNLSALFGGGSDDEIGSDPFVEPVDEADVETAESSASAAESEILPVTADSARELIERAASTEATAENLFRQISDESKQAESEIASAAGSVQERVENAEVPVISPRSGGANPDEASFADFLAEKSAEVRESVQETAEPLFNTAETVRRDVAAAGPAEKSANAFDQLLNLTDAAEENVAAASADELFPGLNQLIPDNDGTQADAAQRNQSPTFDRFAAGRQQPESAGASDDGIGTEFEVARRNHGFVEPQDNDPWSAFRDSQAKPVTVGEPEGFSWVDRNDSAPTPRPEAVASVTGSDATAFHPSEFVESTAFAPEVAEQDAAEENPGPEFDDTLLIPTSQPNPETQNSDPTAAEASETDPFADLMAEAEKTESAEQSDEEPVETAAGFSFSTRTWFLLLGCVIVGLLLFMPDRQKRTNA